MLRHVSLHKVETKYQWVRMEGSKSAQKLNAHVSEDLDQKLDLLRLVYADRQREARGCVLTPLG